MLTDLVEEFQKYMGPEWLIAAPALMVCTVIFESVYLYCSDVRYYFSYHVNFTRNTAGLARISAPWAAKNTHT